AAPKTRPWAADLLRWLLRFSLRHLQMPSLRCSAPPCISATQERSVARSREPFKPNSSLGPSRLVHNCWGGLVRERRRQGRRQNRTKETSVMRARFAVIWGLLTALIAGIAAYVAYGAGLATKVATTAGAGDGVVPYHYYGYGWGFGFFPFFGFFFILLLLFLVFRPRRWGRGGPWMGGG